jgi:hypothetical protein
VIPVSKATIKVVNRFPELYKRQALQAIDGEVTDAIRITADSFVMASAISIIELGLCDPDTEDIHKYISKLQEVIDTSADYYDDAVAEGLRNRLHNYGIDYR